MSVPKLAPTASTKPTFPNDPLLVKLLQAAKQTTGTIVHDEYGFEKNYNQLFEDILQMRELLSQNLPSSTVDNHGYLCEETPYICVLAFSGYEFLVAFFAIRALGGACIPFGSGILPEEALYFMSKAKSTCLLAGKGCENQARTIREYAQDQKGLDITPLSIPCDADFTGELDIKIDRLIEIAPESPGLVLFTSGTTGPPKGAVLPKRCFSFQYIAKPSSASVNYRASHWVGGAEGLIEPVVTGTKLYSLKERTSADAMWELLKKRSITHVLFAPTLLRLMKEFYLENISVLPAQEKEEYIQGFKNMSKISCCSGMIAPSTLRFWTNLSGLPFENVYGSTELGGAAMRTSVETNVVEHSIGAPCPEVEIKLSEGDRGEIRAKSPWMLTHYIGNDEATRSAFDEDGYFKTGDLANLVGGEYVFTGRAIADCVFFHGYRISTLQVENSLTDLPYIADAYVLGVPDHEAKELCGALIRVKKGALPPEEVSLTRIRSDLSTTLSTYMLPALLRVLRNGEEVPLTVSQKPIKKQILKQYLIQHLRSSHLATFRFR